MKTQFYKDKRFWMPILVLVLFELFLQTGIYKPMLKKNSYAANINNILGHVIEKKDVHNPEILIVGTSVAYQGLSLKTLQEKINGKGYKIQSASIPGSELIIQDLAIEKILRELDRVKLIVYVGEITMPWVSQTHLTLPSLGMLGEFSRLDSFPNLVEFGYKTFVPKDNPSFFERHKANFMIKKIDYDDWAFLVFDSIKYRRDIGNFLKDPTVRIRYVKNKYLSPNENFYEYENQNQQKMSSYSIKNLDDCVQKTNPNTNKDPIPSDSDFNHKKAIYDTCALSKYTSPEQNRTAETNLYFKRLAIIYKKIKEKNIKIINVFAPYSQVIDNNLGGAGRLQVWKEELEKLNGPNAEVMDFRNAFSGLDSDAYCYDVIHLNQKGAELFSNALGDYLVKNLDRLMK